MTNKVISKWRNRPTKGNKTISITLINLRMTLGLNSLVYVTQISLTLLDHSVLVASKDHIIRMSMITERHNKVIKK